MNPVHGGAWVVGYGSLIYKPPPHYSQRVIGVVHGFRRRFWQSSSDHRGTPELPGRVATLVPAADARLLVVAYFIPAAHVAAVTAYLDVREQDGYLPQTVPVHLVAPPQPPHELRDALDALPCDSVSGLPVVQSVIYIGIPDAATFVGPEELQRTAAVIAHNHGPSGPNYEYLKLLHSALHSIAETFGARLCELEDHYLDELLEAVDRLRAQACAAVGA
ncbi:AFR184Cp [Eremothecium gossypii ATCC 10895]|uniref:glutathione-specific gamma-glutamylcyclotransferase n=1 Tax=Eremothecium gossypii (strain ATCC 10895 / CBS 109.51 / FGSC 9923 / NRRL Y-1056) TaxID=284811 RepID=Q753Y8_EREGS|nr:AFR184Cp [Eremothecium gossypii ATCC 10895]AAS53555.1 AFR184Cp [Eremothecium gossypii ATCC 10895]AEY97868.1 FAFR184Cp [Eremothecium gossypii FDAG1]